MLCLPGLHSVSGGGEHTLFSSLEHRAVRDGYSVLGGQVPRGWHWGGCEGRKRKGWSGAQECSSSSNRADLTSPPVGAWVRSLQLGAHLAGGRQRLPRAFPVLEAQGPSRSTSSGLSRFQGSSGRMRASVGEPASCGWLLPMGPTVKSDLRDAAQLHAILLQTWPPFLSGLPILPPSLPPVAPSRLGGSRVGLGDLGGQPRGGELGTSSEAGSLGLRQSPPPSLRGLPREPQLQPQPPLGFG